MLLVNIRLYGDSCYKGVVLEQERASGTIFCGVSDDAFLTRKLITN